MNPRHVDAIIDLTYGVLLFIAIGVIVTVGTEIGLAFGFGVLISYGIHVIWKMARFDPDWMTQTVEEAVEQRVEEQVEKVQDQIENVEERVDRRPREDEVAELIEDTAKTNPETRSEQ